MLLRQHDTDGDGKGDNGDNCPNNANDDQQDTDEDEVGDVCDDDDDGDTIVDALDVFNGQDCSLKRDCDGDGVNDNEDAFPVDATEHLDTDRDGVGDNRDNCPSDANGDQQDTDEDEVGDVCDDDDDGDTIADALDVFGGQDCSLKRDCDGDGVNDNEDAFPVDATEHLDTDTDGVGDNGDNCPNNANDDQQDTDEDEVGDVCDDDDDGDTIVDALDVFGGQDCSLKRDCDGDGHNDNVDAFPVDATEHLDTDRDGVGDNGDNCPSDANGDQQDTDEDEVGDVCDDDDDGDTIADALDVFNGQDCSLKRDCDGDGVNDNEDAFPVDATETADTDTDGVGDNGDNCPNNANDDQQDTDEDEVGDVCDDDDDGDTIVDALDVFGGQDCSLKRDCDGDGHNDNVDAFPVDDTEHLDTDTDGVGDNGDNCPNNANDDQQDTDEDEVGDVCDDDDDGDTIVDALDVFGGRDCSLKKDCDGDGVNDNEDAFPVDATETADTDGDGRGDNGDNCPNNANDDQQDTDEDEVGRRLR